MTRLISLRHKVTGKYGQYPAHFADRDDFEVYDPENCQDCVAQEEETEPAPKEAPASQGKKKKKEEVDGS